MLQEGARMLAEDGPQVDMSSIQHTDPGLGLRQGQGLKGKARGMEYFRGGWGGGDEGVGSQRLFFLTEAQVRHRSQQGARSEWGRRALREDKR